MGYGKKPDPRKNGVRAKFAACLIADPKRNATAAYIAAGGSPNGAKTEACKLLQCAEIQKQIAAADAKAMAKLGNAAVDVLAELNRIANPDNGEETKDRIAALTLLAKNQKLLTDKVEHSGSVVQFNWSVPR